MVFIPIAAIMISGSFIVCPHKGPSVICEPPVSLLTGLFADVPIAQCTSSPGFLRREHGFLYFTVASDMVTDIMRK